MLWLCVAHEKEIPDFEEIFKSRISKARAGRRPVQISGSIFGVGSSE
jgi:hypothetical protein